MFPELNGNGRVWFYTCNRPLSAIEKDEISKHLNSFIHTWSAHGAQLLAGFEIFMDQILILAVDENFEAASGCSIDSSVQEFRLIEQKFDLDLFNRLNLPFVIQDKIVLVPLAGISDAVTAKKLDLNSSLLDTSISTIADLRDRFFVPLGDSWIANRIKKFA